MITLEQAQRLVHGQILHHTHLRGADRRPLRARVNGRCITWKSRPGDFRLPMKHGLRHCFDITPTNASEWTTDLVP